MPARFFAREKAQKKLTFCILECSKILLFKTGKLFRARSLAGGC